MHRLLLVALAAGLLAACTNNSSPSNADAPSAPPAPPPPFTLSSPAFENETQMPKVYTVDGTDISPPLTWSNPPANTREFALVCDDPTARGWVHWVIYAIPGGVRELPEGLPRDDKLAGAFTASQGKNNWRKVGYYGPAARKGGGVHGYHFTLYALDAPLGLAPEATKSELVAAMEGHILGSTVLIGNNER